MLLRLVSFVVLAALVVAHPTTAFAAHTYIVQSGDTLSGIAIRFQTTVDALVALNGIANPDLIYVGQQLAIPHADGEAVASPSPAPAPPPMHGPWPRAGVTGERSILASTRLVTYYGNPWSDLMGILGELSKEELVRRLGQVAQTYEQAGGRPTRAAIHLIATVAQAEPGADGLYRLRMSASVIQEYADRAAAHSMLLIIDLQPGLSSVAAEIEAVRPWLALPHVHLALDPEFTMRPGQVPGQQLGSMDASEINHAIGVLASIAAEHDLPNKILIVHQFTASMITNKMAIRDDPRVDVVIDMDGFGGRGIKIRHYEWYVRDEPVEFAGIKLFYRQDTDLLQPGDLMALDPRPDVVIYQ
jgi:hypothetical protein